MPSLARLLPDIGTLNSCSPLLSDPKPPGEPSERSEPISTRWRRGALSRVATDIGAQRLYERGWLGEGVTVAVIDTGIADTPTHGGRRLSPILSIDVHNGTPEFVGPADPYGHGTHLAGIIAGLAPAASLLSVNVADDAGDTDRQTVSAGVEWVIEHAETYGIRVVLLAYSDDPNFDRPDDPLLRSVQRAWDSGLVVIAAGGNEGQDSNGLTAPATSHSTIAVTAAEPGIDGSGSYRLASWASGGNRRRQADVAAPGTSIEGTRSHGSVLDRLHPEGRDGAAMFRGTGTSQAAAVVAAAVALLLCQRPELAPDDVKAEIIASASPLADGTVGLLDLTAATMSAAGTRWSGTRWSGTRWSGTRWSGTRWSGTRWS